MLTETQKKICGVLVGLLPKVYAELTTEEWAKNAEAFKGSPWSTVEELKKHIDEERVKAPVVMTIEGEESYPDMPTGVLCGYLGEVCRSRLADFPVAFSWLAVLAAASVMVKPSEKRRCNINVCLVGAVNAGKSQAFDRANFLFRLSEQGILEDAKCGSAEGLAEHIGDKGGTPVLWFPDELAHVLDKACIQNASFPSVLNSIFYKDGNVLRVQKRAKVNFNARLSIAGGVVLDHFGDSFGSATTSGLYDRFLFGRFPTNNFNYSYRPMKGAPLFNLSLAPKDTLFDPKTMSVGPRYEAPEVEDAVWEACSAFAKEENIGHRVVELCLRTALICAAWDKRDVLRTSDLGPCWELARYQQKLRTALQPNPGRNFDAMAAHKIKAYLERPMDGEGWFEWRDVYRATRLSDLGPGVGDRAMKSLGAIREIEQIAIEPPNGGRKKLLIRLARD